MKTRIKKTQLANTDTPRAYVASGTNEINARWQRMATASAPEQQQFAASLLFFYCLNS
jgi:hypothetical protein